VTVFLAATTVFFRGDCAIVGELLQMRARGLAGERRGSITNWRSASRGRWGGSEHVEGDMDASASQQGEVMSLLMVRFAALVMYFVLDGRRSEQKDQTIGAVTRKRERNGARRPRADKSTRVQYNRCKRKKSTTRYGLSIHPLHSGSSTSGRPCRSEGRAHGANAGQRRNVEDHAANQLAVPAVEDH
jgi:hypothetical protein